MVESDQNWKEDVKLLEIDGVSKQDKKLPAYKLWPGNNMFFCKGKLIAGPLGADIGAFLFTWSTILFFSGLWFWFPFPYLWKKVSWLLPVLSIDLFVATIVMLLLTSLTDPGIIPRKKWKELIEPHLSKDEESGGALNPKMYRSNYCRTCEILRPRRSHHCRTCNNCVAVWDHHCPFVNNCIGVRNYGFFIGFIFSVCSLALVVAIGTIFYLGAKQRESLKIENNYEHVNLIIFVVLLIPVLLLTIALCWLSCYHFYIICKGQTTKEQIKGIKPNIHAEKNASSTLPMFACKWWIRHGPCAAMFKNRPPSKLNLQMMVEVPYGWAGKKKKEIF